VSEFKLVWKAVTSTMTSRRRRQVNTSDGSCSAATAGLQQQFQLQLQFWAQLLSEHFHYRNSIVLFLLIHGKIFIHSTNTSIQLLPA
jgi:hypothetical protein